jgi:hypothetical protein
MPYSMHDHPPAEEVRDNARETDRRSHVAENSVYNGQTGKIVFTASTDRGQTFRPR